MAKRRDVKKDIDFLAYEVISDCFTFMHIKDVEKSDEVSSIINDTVSLRNDLVARVNHPDGKDNTKLVKAHFKKVYQDLLEGMDKQFSRLSALTKQL